MSIDDRKRIPAHSITIILKFKSDEERMKLINDPEYSRLTGELSSFAIQHNAEIVSKLSRK